jgi:hypothetical protein
VEIWQQILIGIAFCVSSIGEAHRFWQEGERASAVAVLMIGWAAGILTFIFPILVPAIWPTAKASPSFDALVIIVLLVLAVGSLWNFALLWQKLRK